MINEYSLKFSPEQISIPFALKRGSRYKIKGEIEVRTASEVETDDELPDAVYKVKVVPPLEILMETGKIIKSVDKTKMSKKLRGRIYIDQDENEMMSIDQETYYKGIMGDLITNYEEIRELLKKKPDSFISNLKNFFN